MNVSQTFQQWSPLCCCDTRLIIQWFTATLWALGLLNEKFSFYFPLLDQCCHLQDIQNSNPTVEVLYGSLVQDTVNKHKLNKQILFLEAEQ